MTKTDLVKVTVFVTLTASPPPTHVADDLAAAVDWILGGGT